MDRPSSPLFVPGKCGVDAETQVVVGELFEFDLEVFVDGYIIHTRTTTYYRFAQFHVAGGNLPTGVTMGCIARFSS